MFNSPVRWGKACPAKQKIIEFKKVLFWGKRLHVATSAKRFNSRKLTRLAVENMNNINSQKYGYPTNTIKEKAIENERLRDIYEFYRLIKVKQHAERHEHADVEKDKINT